MPEPTAATERISVDLTRCDGCGICVDSCPVDVLRADAAAHKMVIAYPNDCQACYLCQDDCPQDAITVSFSSANPRRRSIYDVLGIA
jgi:NAD-dependent dihydropyrimidine dehydrogenase PreA subunit